MTKQTESGCAVFFAAELIGCIRIFLGADPLACSLNGHGEWPVNYSYPVH
jgi:hypothetical protein